jgi:hypothetical protein
MAHLPTMATPLPIDPDTITITSAASGVAPSDMAAALTTIQAASQQEKAAMAAATAITSGVVTAPTDLVAALANLQVRVAAAKAEAQQSRAAATTLQLQLAAVLGVAAPPPRPTTIAAPAPGQAAPIAGAFKTSSIGYLHAQAVGIQDIRTLVPVVLSVTSTQYPR